MKYKFTSGFSLVETLVAVSILLVVIVGPLAIVTNATRSTNFSNEQVVATFLAQEGVELAQLARDNLLLKDFKDDGNGSRNAWDKIVSDYSDCFLPAGCGLILDGTHQVSVHSCTSVSCRLYLSSDSRTVYTYDDSSTNTLTPYTRIVQMKEIVPDEQMKVTTTVTWRTNDQRREQSVEVVTYLYNIYDR